MPTCWVGGVNPLIICCKPISAQASRVTLEQLMSVESLSVVPIELVVSRISMMSIFCALPPDCSAYADVDIDTLSMPSARAKYVGTVAVSLTSIPLGLVCVAVQVLPLLPVQFTVWGAAVMVRLAFAFLSPDAAL